MQRSTYLKIGAAVVLIGVIILVSGTTFIKQLMTRISMDNVVGIVAIITGISGMIVGISSNKNTRLSAVKEYFQQGDGAELSKHRKFVQESPLELLVPGNPPGNEAASHISSFYNFWGIMVMRSYLPIWVFDGASGYTAVNLHWKLKHYLEIRRKSNPKYAFGFTWLVQRIQKKYQIPDPETETVKAEAEAVPAAGESA